MLRFVFRLIVLAIVLACVSAAIAYVVVRGHGFSARATPGPIETRVARSARGLAIPAEAARRASPEPQTADSLRAGLEHFADHCALCHANDGSGDTEIGRGLYPKVPDMRLPATQTLSDGELFYIIENGVPLTGMPGWGGGDAEGEKATWHLVQFVRHLPKLTPEEAAAMSALNPRPPAESDAIDPDEFLKGAPVPPPGQHKHKHGKDDR